MKKSLFLIPLAIMAISCSHTTTVKDTSGALGYTYTEKTQKKDRPTMVPMNQTSYMPNATAFRMSGDFADNVAITVDNNGVVTYFPAPGDLTADSRPIELSDGWWLNRQGLGPNSVFTKYTFAEYAALPQAPTAEQLKKDLIPGARVIQFYELPYKVGEASQHIPEIKKLLKNL